MTAARLHRDDLRGARRRRRAGAETATGTPAAPQQPPLARAAARRRARRGRLLRRLQRARRRWRPGCSALRRPRTSPAPARARSSVVVEPGQTGEDIATTLRDAGVVKSRSAYLEVAASRPQARRRHPARHLRAAQGDAGPGGLRHPGRPRPTATSTARRSARGCGPARPTPRCRSRPASRSRSTSRPPRTPRRSACPRRPRARSRAGCSRRATSSPTKSTATAAAQGHGGRRPSRCSTRPGSTEKDRQEVLTLASLVEAEAKLDEDRPKIARVFLNRVETDGAPAYGLIQSDAAVSYGAQRRVAVPDQGRARRRRATPTTPASTPGLPPGPISNPGAASIDAAAEPRRRALVLLRRGQPDHR